MGFASLEAIVFPPLPQADNDQKKVTPLLGENIFPIRTVIGDWRSVQNFERQKPLQACGQDAFGNAEAFLELAKPAHAVKGIADDEEGPPVTDGIQ